MTCPPRAFLLGAALTTALAATAAVMPAAGAEITVMRGSTQFLVDTRHPGRTPAVLRPIASAPAAGGASQPMVVVVQPTAAAGSPLWYRARGGWLQACSMRGTGYVGEFRIYCTTR